MGMCARRRETHSAVDLHIDDERRDVFWGEVAGWRCFGDGTSDAEGEHALSHEVLSAVLMQLPSWPSAACLRSISEPRATSPARNVPRNTFFLYIGMRHGHGQGRRTGGGMRWGWGSVARARVRVCVAAAQSQVWYHCPPQVEARVVGGPGYTAITWL